MNLDLGIRTIRIDYEFRYIRTAFELQQNSKGCTRKLNFTEYISLHFYKYRIMLYIGQKFF